MFTVRSSLECKCAKESESPHRFRCRPAKRLSANVAWVIAVVGAKSDRRSPQLVRKPATAAAGYWSCRPFGRACEPQTSCFENECRRAVAFASAPPCRLDGGDIDLLHCHHRFDRTLCRVYVETRVWTNMVLTACGSAPRPGFAFGSTAICGSVLGDRRIASNSKPQSLAFTLRKRQEM